MAGQERMWGGNGRSSNVNIFNGDGEGGIVPDQGRIDKIGERVVPSNKVEEMLNDGWTIMANYGNFCRMRREPSSQKEI